MNDISERHDLITKNKKVAGRLTKKLDQWLKKTKATFPDPNPGYTGQAAN